MAQNIHLKGKLDIQRLDYKNLRYIILSVQLLPLEKHPLRNDYYTFQEHPQEKPNMDESLIIHRIRYFLTHFQQNLLIR